VLSLHVLFLIGQPCKPAMTNVTGVRRRSSVDTLVVGERTRLQKPLTTFATLKWSLPSVTSHVSAQPRWSSTLFVADRASVRLLAGMNHANVPPHVAQT